MDSLTILLVEDDEQFARYMRVLLERCGLPIEEVVEANRLELAVEQLRERKFSCVLLDLTLPNGAGMRVIDRLLGFSPPLVIVTGDENAETATRALEHGAQEFITKSKLATNGPEILGRLLSNAVFRGRGMNQLVAARCRSLCGHVPVELGL